MSAAIAAVQARIATLQGLVGTPGGSGVVARLAHGAPGGVLGGDPSAPSASGGSFAGDLAAATADLGGAVGSVAAGPAATPASTSRSSGTTGSDVVAAAKEYVGVPYVKGGDDPRRGLDCSGLTELVYAKFGVDLRPVSWEQVKQGRPVESLAKARPGDLVFFGRPTHHVGIYAGDGTMVHAPRPGKVVEVGPVWETPSYIRRVLPDAAASSPAPAPAGSLAAVTTPTGSAAAGVVPALRAYAGALPSSTPYAELFRAAESRHGVPARVLAALAQVESGFKATAVSPAGALGLMQFMPATARGFGIDPLDPAQAVDGAARLMKQNVRDFGSLELALAAYNAGGGAVRRYGGIPPYEETQGHVRKVMTILKGVAA